MADGRDLHPRPRELSLSTLADQVGAVTALLEPLQALIEAHDLPLNFHPAATGVRFYLRCSPTLDRRMLDFSGEEHFANLIRNGPIRPPEKYSY